MSNNNNNIMNFYETKAVQYHNPNYKNSGVKHPFRMVVVAPSGSGKTNATLNIIQKLDDTFEHIYVCTKMPNEPLYKYLQDALKDQITFYSDLSEMPDARDLEVLGQTLVIYDDMVNEHNLSKVKDMFMMGRKINTFGCSMMFLSQSYFSIPTFIRKNTNYITILKLSGKRDLNLILSEFSLGVDKDELIEMYKNAIKKKLDFFKIDVETENDNMRFSHNFTDYFQIE